MVIFQVNMVSQFPLNFLSPHVTDCALFWDSLDTTKLFISSLTMSHYLGRPLSFFHQYIHHCTKFDTDTYQCVQAVLVCLSLLLNCMVPIPTISIFASFFL